MSIKEAVGESDSPTVYCDKYNVRPTSQHKMFRRISILFILLTAVFFAVGWWPVQREWITKYAYLTAAGIVGGIASVVGLLGLVCSPLTRKDFENVEWESVTKIAESERKLLELEGQKAKAHSELQQLTRTKEELADLVRKASAVHYLRDEIDRSTEKILATVQSSPELRKELDDLRDRMGRLSKLNEEVQMHPDAALILEVIQRSRYRKVDRRKEMLDSLRAVPVFGPVLRVLYLVLESYGRALRIVVK